MGARDRRRQDRVVGDGGWIAAGDDAGWQRGDAARFRFRVRSRAFPRRRSAPRFPQAIVSREEERGLNDAVAEPGFAGGEGLRRGAGVLRRQARLPAHRRQLRSRTEQALGGHRATRRAGKGAKLLLARGVGPEQTSRIGNQTGGRVFLFLYTDDFWRDFNAYKALGIEFVREPSEAPYGTVAVFKDLYGTLWDLVQPRAPS